ncbi:conserved hypothetical protein [gamma proteobacterium HTCC5015]|nr:conserved hypothetical protein [gamma proteobacterium HTCC5015]
MGRVSQAGAIYSVTLACYQKQALFADFYSGRCFVKGLKEVESQADTLCFVVMPDHVHWLFQLSEKASLSVVVQKVKSITRKEWGRQMLSHQPLWQRGFYDRAIRAEKDILPIARYIVANPVRANLVKRVGDYPLWDAIWL